MTTINKTDIPRIICFQPKPKAKIRLFAFPHAGAGANTYRDWDMGEEVEIWALQYPGREWRRQQPAAANLADLTQDLMASIQDNWPADLPVAFWGYSMGAIVAYSLAQTLAPLGLQPHALFLGASRAPHMLPEIDPIHLLDDDSFLEKLRYLGGMPDAVLQEPALLELALPILRNDFALLVAHRETSHNVLNCPIKVYGGSRDSLANREQLAAWQVYTHSDFSLRIFNGNHFFMNTSRGQLLATLKSDLQFIYHKSSVNAGLRSESRLAVAG